MKYLLKTWWGRLFILFQITWLATSIYLSVAFVLNSHKVENDSISGILGAEDTIEFNDGKAPTAEQLKSYYANVDKTTEEQSHERLIIPIYYLLSNLAVPTIWCICLFICKGLPSKSRTKPIPELS
jgi:hypothetical protein